MVSTPQGCNCREIKKLTSYDASDVYQGQDGYINTWDLYQLEPNNKKHNKDKMGDEGIK